MCEHERAARGEPSGDHWGTVDDLAGRVAVVTGGAAGIGRGIVGALLDEAPGSSWPTSRHRCSSGPWPSSPRGGEVRGVVTDVADPGVGRVAGRRRLRRAGACTSSSNNAGVTSGGGGMPWEQELNDWRWCFSVNVFGMANGVLTFVPRMLGSGEQGTVVATSSGDGGHRAGPLRLRLRLLEGGGELLHRGRGPPVRGAGDQVAGARVFYPVGRSPRHGSLGGPAQPARRAGPGTAPAARTRDDVRRVQGVQLAAAGRPTETVDLDELGRFAVQGVKEGRFVIGHDLDRAGRLLHARADAIAKGRPAPVRTDLLT